jgi:hypothetical protein
MVSPLDLCPSSLSLEYTNPIFNISACLDFITRIINNATQPTEICFLVHSNALTDDPTSLCELFKTSDFLYTRLYSPSDQLSLPSPQRPATSCSLEPALIPLVGIKQPTQMLITKENQDTTITHTTRYTTQQKHT